ncbi:MAG TPA: preprotein translocase subunit YajC [Opitutaceae bacterium]|nr:preprotein translocase subunit YajC [Opitutaceae bacterium]
MTKLFPIESAAVIGQAAPAGGNGMIMLLFWGLFFAAMWFLLIAPQRKKQKQHQKMLTELKSGDEIITAGGVYGTITNVRDDRFALRVGDGTKVEINKAFVHAVVKKSD